MTTGNANIAIGSGALALETAGSCNVAVGTCALYASAGGVGNTALGTAAGDLVTTGDCNTFLGFDAGATTTTGSNQVVIGAVGTASSATVNNEASIFAGTTVARFAQGAVAWTFTSDARRKENIEDLALGLDFVSELQPRSFDWKEDGKHAAGFIAQEVDAVVEKFGADYLGAVSKADPECYTVAQAALIPVLVNAIKELKAEVAELKKKLG